MFAVAGGILVAVLVLMILACILQELSGHTL
jgi:hypothetical protein